MKGFGALIVATVIGFLGYQVAYPKIFDPSFFPKDGTPSKNVGTKPVEIPEVAALKQTQPAAPVEPKQPPKPSVTPSVPSTTAMAEPVKKTEDPDEFHPPVIPALEDIVKNWTAIPKKVFPRAVKLRKTVEFVMPIGKSRVGPGGIVTALDQQGGSLIVAPTENSPARGLVALDDTDLKETLGRAYESWKVQIVAFKRQQWEVHKNTPQAPKDTKAPSVVAGNDKPARNGDGTYPLLLASMKSGQVTDVTPSNITKWHEAVSEKIDGKAYWVVVVDVTIISMFGPIPTVAEAHIFNGRVEKWIYTKSREVVP